MITLAAVVSAAEPSTGLSFVTLKPMVRTILYLVCDDIKATVRKLTQKKVKCSAPVKRTWGTLTKVTLPSGGKLGLYQPKHPLARS